MGSDSVSPTVNKEENTEDQQTITKTKHTQKTFLKGANRSEERERKGGKGGEP